MLHFLRRCSYLFSHIPPIFSVLLTYSLEINSLLFDPPCSSLVVGYKGSSTETRISSACEVSRRREEPRCDVTSPALRRFDWLPVTRARRTPAERALRNASRARAPLLAPFVGGGGATGSACRSTRRGAAPKGGRKSARCCATRHCRGAHPRLTSTPLRSAR